MAQFNPGSDAAHTLRVSSAHEGIGAPSPWLVRFSKLIPAGGNVLDHACGGGRHARWLAREGFQVEATDRDRAALAGLAGEANVTAREVDLEQGQWPYAGVVFDAVVVSNYLFRPRFDLLLEAVAPGGVLIYETFMIGNEKFGKPSNPDFLLAPGELLQRTAGWHVVAFEQGVVSAPRNAAIQRICAVNGQSEGIALP
ncbi:MAG: methyltransferase domain-containing protein [Azoarcus sp.]|nr:methyltransferase domain-containing protein [Azoarcus sp.]